MRGNNTANKLTITVICEKELRNPSEDDIESGVANKPHIMNEE